MTVKIQVHFNTFFDFSLILYHLYHFLTFSLILYHLQTKHIFQFSHQLCLTCVVHFAWIFCLYAHTYAARTYIHVSSIVVVQRVL